MDAVNDDKLAKVHEAGFLAEKNERGCCQCVLLAVRDLYDVPPQVFQAASGLSGGVGLSGEGPCGAFLGGAMLISSLFGRKIDNLSDKGAMRRSAAYVRKFKEHFDAEYGSFNCADIQRKIMGRGGFKLYIPEEYQAFESLGGHDDKCTNVVGKAAVWLVKTIEGIRKEEEGAS